MLIAQDSLNFYQEANSQKLPGVTQNWEGDVATGFSAYISQILTGLMAVAALLVLFYLIMGAIDWINSGGDKAKTEKARDKMTQAVIGLIVLSATFVIFMFVQGFLNVQIITII